MQSIESSSAYVQKCLLGLQDKKYKEFNAKLIPNVPPEKIIGVRTPVLRKFAAEFIEMPESRDFLKQLPHEYHEENSVHSFLIEKMKSYTDVITALDTFLPFVNNWAVCDSMKPKVFKKHLPELAEKIPDWLASGKTYAIRFGIGMLMTFFLDDSFEEKYLQMVCDVVSDEYYVNMMKAWYFATALAKQYDSALLYLTGRRLDVWTHNKTIQKAVESYRITGAQKEYLRTLKVLEGD